MVEVVKSKEQEKAELMAAKFNLNATLFQRCWLATAQFSDQMIDHSARAVMARELFLANKRDGVELI